MGKLTVTLNDEIERAFRERVKVVYGEKKGALSIAAEKIISEWLKSAVV
jgi:hypothetical protein